MQTGFGKALKSARRAKGFTQMQLAERAGMHPTTISGFELGKREPTLLVIWTLANALEMSASELLAGMDS